MDFVDLCVCVFKDSQYVFFVGIVPTGGDFISTQNDN